MRLITSTESVVDRLSLSEKAVVELIVEYFGENITKKIIKKTGTFSQKKITNSVVISAIKKLEIVGVIKTKSLGAKGTYFEILNKDALLDIGNRLKYSRRIG